MGVVFEVHMVPQHRRGVKPLVARAEGGAKLPTHVVGLGVTPTIHKVCKDLWAEVTPILSSLAITPPWMPSR